MMWLLGLGLVGIASGLCDMFMSLCRLLQAFMSLCCLLLGFMSLCWLLQVSAWWASTQVYVICLYSLCFLLQGFMSLCWLLQAFMSLCCLLLGFMSLCWLLQVSAWWASTQVYVICLYSLCFLLQAIMWLCFLLQGFMSLRFLLQVSAWWASTRVYGTSHQDRQRHVLMYAERSEFRTSTRIVQRSVAIHKLLFHEFKQNMHKVIKKKSLNVYKLKFTGHYEKCVFNEYDNI